MKIKKFVSIAVSFFLFAAFSHSQEIGVVLSGGGGKGAYEVGVWKAFVEYGIAQKVTVISGTSVGGLNAGLFACEPVDRVIGFWKVFVPDELWNNTYELIDQNGLLRIINQVDLSKMQVNPYPKVYVTATRRRFFVVKFLSKILFDADYSHRFLLNEESDISEIKNLMLATSAFPIFTKAIELKDGFKYVDGGVSDNTPIEPLFNEEIHQNLGGIFVVHLGYDGKYSEKYPDEKIVDIFPSKNLGGLNGVIDFSESTVKSLIDLGYQDTVEILKNSGMYPVSEYWFE